MQITRNLLDSNRGPADWFTGTVYIDTIAAPSPPTRAAAASLRFTLGARTGPGTATPAARRSMKEYKGERDQ